MDEELLINIDIPPITSFDISGVEEKDVDPTLRLLERILQNATQNAVERFFANLNARQPQTADVAPPFATEGNNLENEQEEEKTFTHYIAYGETLGVLAKKYGTTVEELMRLNNLKSKDYIRAGEKLQIPASCQPLPEDLLPYKKREPSKGGNYIVRKNDNLWNLAKKFNTTVDELARLNNIDAANLGNIYEGEELFVPVVKQKTQDKNIAESDFLKNDDFLQKQMQYPTVGSDWFEYFGRKQKESAIMYQQKQAEKTRIASMAKKVIIDNTNTGNPKEYYETKIGEGGLDYDDKFFVPILEQLYNENLINSESTVTFKLTKDEPTTRTVSTGPWYWPSTDTQTWAQYDVSFNYEGELITLPAEIAVSSVHHFGSSPIDYPLALIGTGAYSQAIKGSLANEVKLQLNTHFTKTLQAEGVNIKTGEAIYIGKATSGEIVWLAEGMEKAGLKHILRHTDEFINIGVAKDDIGKFVYDAVKNGKVVGTQGKGAIPRNIYETVYKGETKLVAVSVSKNGFIVGANPVTKLK